MEPLAKGDSAMTTDRPVPAGAHAPATTAGAHVPSRSSMPRDQALDVSRMVAACIILLHHGALFYTTAGGPQWFGRDATEGLAQDRPITTAGP